MATKRIGNINISYTVPAQQTQLYNMLGRAAGAEAVQDAQQNSQGGGDNFFVKRGKSIENALGTTGAAIASGVKSGGILGFKGTENIATENMLKDNKTRMNEIAKKYGYNTYHDVWDARDKAKAEGDTATLDLIDNTINPELRAQANANAKKADEKAANYKDYMENNYVSKKINQDQGKFAGSAINTLSTAVDVTGLGATPLSNAIQGGVEGLADELEQNGFKDFSWERAGQNALIGATTGAVTGALNKGISNSLAKNGGNLFAGNNALSRGLNKVANIPGPQRLLGKYGGKVGQVAENTINTVGTGAIRGAVSGAVGGATGAGLQSAMNGVEFGQGVQNALQGAVQGAKQGVVSGGIMAGANAALGKTNFGKQLQNAKTNWDQSGSNFDERLTNTLTSGDSAVGDWLMNKRQSNVLGAAGNLGNRMQFVDDQGNFDVEKYNENNRNVVDRLEQNPDFQALDSVDKAMLKTSIMHGGMGALPGGEITTDNALSLSSDDFASTLEGMRRIIYSGSLTDDQAAELAKYYDGYNTPTTAKGWAKQAGKRIVEDINSKGAGLTVKDTSLAQYENDPGSRVKLISEIAERAETLKSQPRGKYGTNSWDNDLFEYPDIDEKVLNTLGISGDLDGASAAAVTQVLKEKGIIPDTNTPTTAKGWVKKAGERIVDDINNSNLGLRVKDVSSDMPEDIRNMQIRDYNVSQSKNGPTPSGLDRVTKAFDESTNQRVLTNRGGKDFALGEFGSNNLQRKANAQHNLSEADIKNIIDTSDRQSISGDSSFRKDNVAWFGDLPNGERGTVITRLNSLGQEEVINAYKNNPGYEAELLKTYGTPAQSRTGSLGLEDLGDGSASQGRSSIIQQNRQNVNLTDPWDRVAQEAGYSNYDEVLQRYAEANPNVKINPRGMAGQVLTWMDQNPNTPTTATGWAKRAGQRLAEDANNSNLGLRVKDVSQDTTAETPSTVDSRQTELYRALAGKQNSPVEAISESEYGESALANRTKRGMLADALERAGNTLEGAQANVTRAAANDLGIESAGKSIENVRKRTGLTNLETQAAFAKELTGGADSLLDNVQRMALTESADGRPYTVDTSDVAAKVESIVDKYADTNTFGSQNKRNQFISNLRRDISSYDSDVLSIAKRMKSNASAYRGKGVVDPPPADTAKANIYTEIANELEDLSYKAIPQENVDAMFDTAIVEMQDRAAQATANGNKEIAEAYTNSANDLENTPRTVKAYRSFKKDFVDVSKINDLTAKAENGAATQMGRSFGAGIKRLTGTLLQRPVNAALAKVGGAINTVADKIDGGGEEVVTPQIATPADMAAATANYNPSTQLYNAIGRTEGLTNAEQARTANYLADAAQEAEVVPNTNATNVSSLYGTNATNVASYPDTGATSVYNSLYGTPTTTLATAQTSNTNTGYFQPTGDYWTDVIASAMTSAIDADDVTAFATLYDMYQNQLANLQKQASSSESSSQQKLTATQQRANAAMNSLDRLKNMEPDTAYNLSGIPIIGNIATFGGNDYEAEAKSLAQQIGYMVSGSNIKDSEAENIGKSYVPQPWDNETVRQNKLRRAYEIIQRYQNGYAE